MGRQLGLLFVSLLLMVGAMLFESPVTFGLAAVTALVSLAWLRVRSALLLWTFWIWVNGILLLIFYAPQGDPAGPLIFGLPLPALCMLGGIWLFPVLLWPLGFARRFQDRPDP